MDDFGEEESMNQGVGKDPRDVDIEKDVSEDHQDGQGKRKRKLASQVWSMFEILPLAEDRKERSKCKKCGALYLCHSCYGIENLRRYITNCPKRDTRDIGQLILTQSKGSMSMRSSKIDPHNFRELLVKSKLIGAVSR